MKRIFTLLFVVMLSFAAYGQWATPGSFIHIGANPQLFTASNGIHYEINHSSIPTSSSYAGLKIAALGTEKASFGYNFGLNRMFLGQASNSVDNAYFSLDLGGTLLTTNNSGFANIGSRSGFHLAFDDQNIQAKGSLTSETVLFLNKFGGNVVIGASGNSGQLWHDANNGRIGIGTSSPQTQLHLVGDEGVTLESNDGSLIYFKTNSIPLGFVGAIDGDVGMVNQFATGSIALLTASNDGLTIVDASGGSKVGINTESPNFTLDVSGDGNFSGELTAMSDMRLKKNIRPLHNATEAILALNPVSYDFRTDEFSKMGLSQGRRLGLIAQEVEKVFPDLVSHKGKGTNNSGEELDLLSVNYIDLIPVLIKAFQDEHQENVALKSRLENMEVLIQQLISTSAVTLEGSK